MRKVVDPTFEEEFEKAILEQRMDLIDRRLTLEREHLKAGRYDEFASMVSEDKLNILIYQTYVNHVFETEDMLLEICYFKSQNRRFCDFVKKFDFCKKKFDFSCLDTEFITNINLIRYLELFIESNVSTPDHVVDLNEIAFLLLYISKKLEFFGNLNKSEKLKFLGFKTKQLAQTSLYNVIRGKEEIWYYLKTIYQKFGEKEISAKNLESLMDDSKLGDVHIRILEKEGFIEMEDDILKITSLGMAILLEVL